MTSDNTTNGLYDIVNARFALSASVAIEDFDDESLVFFFEERRLVKINAVTRDILNHLDGKRTVRNIVNALAADYAISVDVLLMDVVEVLEDLKDENIIKDMNRLTKIKDFKNMEDTKYSINHDVSCRIEEPEGAILFNPETDAVQAINPTGLAIWQALEYPKTKQEIIEYLLDACEGVPADQVAQDVNEFLENLELSGLIGEVMEEGID